MPAYVPVGSSISVNSQTSLDQSRQSAVRLADGTFVVVWQSTNTAHDGSFGAIRVQRYSATGTAIGAETQVNTAGVGDQSKAQVTALAGGGYVVTWETGDAAQDGNGTAIKAQIFSNSGVAIGSEFLVNTASTGNQQQPTITGLADGSFVVVWQTSDTTADGQGGALKAQRFSASGAPLGSEFLVNTSAFGTQNNADVAALEGGGYVVTWQIGNSGSSTVFAQAFTDAGVKVGSEIIVAASSFDSNVTALASGGFAVTYFRGTSTFVRIYGSNQAPVGSEIFVAEGLSPEIQSLSDGNFVVNWQTSLGSYSQVYSTTGVAVSPQFLVSDQANRTFEGRLVSLDNGGFAALWTSGVSGFGTGNDVGMRLFRPNAAPELGAATRSVSVGENGTGIAAITATDDGTPSPLTYAIIGGADSARFSISASSGFLSFISARDFETPTDVNGDNVYEVIVRASDGDLTDTQTVLVTVTNVNEAPMITSNGAGATAAIAVSENMLLATTVTATDPENTPRIYSISGGADAALFAIDAATGALSFLSTPDFEAPGDVNGDNIYNVTVRASDGTLTDTQALTITVTNANEAPVITSNGGGALAVVAVDENGTAVTTVTSFDADGSPRTYAIVGGADAALFAIDAATGALSFVAAPDREAPGDADSDSNYEVVVEASDGSLSDSQAISVTVGNVNEAPVINSNGGGANAAISVSENSAAVTTVAAGDADGPSISFAIAGGADAALFAIDPLSGVLSFVGTPDFEAPVDTDLDNVYDVVVLASDGSLTDMQTLAVTIGDVNEVPEIVSNGGGAAAALSVAENSTAVTTVSATDPDGNPRTYSIVGGADSALFAIDAVSGALSFLTAPDHETPGDADGNNIYDVVVAASDGALTDTQAISVTVGNVNEAPSITSNGGGASAAIGVSENSMAVTTVIAGDVDSPSISFAVAGGADAALFAIDPVTGVLSFVAAPDFEAPADADGDNVYDILVSASDGSLIDTQSLLIAVDDLNEAPEITSGGGGSVASYSLGEGSITVATVAASDPDGNPRTYSIAGGADAARFTIDPVSGALAFVVTPDFETPTDADGNNVYDLIVQASDGVLADTQALSVTVTNVNETPVITSNGGGAAATVTVNENAATVTTVTSTDPEGNPRSYSIIGGADAVRFTIDAATGALAFINAPNFEAPTDAGANNVYDVIVQVSDGTLANTQALAVTVANVNEAPSITSNGGGATASVAVNENTTAVTTINSIDPEGIARTYSIVGGADAARFTVNASTGVLSFVSAPNFEAPADVGGNNVYDVIVQASDGVNATTQALAVAVNNVVDGSTINGTNSANTLTGTVAEDTINGRGGNDTITGGLGADTLIGGSGADRFTFTSLLDSRVGAMDVITDFARSQSDRISLSAIDANANVAGDQAFTFVGSAAFSNIAGQLRYQQIGGNTIISGDVNGDGVADFAIQVNGTLVPIASDFIL